MIQICMYNRFLLTVLEGKWAFGLTDFNDPRVRHFCFFLLSSPMVCTFHGPLSWHTLWRSTIKTYETATDSIMHRIFGIGWNCRRGSNGARWCHLSGALIGSPHSATNCYAFGSHYGVFPLSQWEINGNGNVLLVPKNIQTHPRRCWCKDMSHHYVNDEKSTENVNLRERTQEFETQRFNGLKYIVDSILDSHEDVC